jgi:hypothetical protein
VSHPIAVGGDDTREGVCVLDGERRSGITPNIAFHAIAGLQVYWDGLLRVAPNIVEKG